MGYWAKNDDILIICLRWVIKRKLMNKIATCEKKKKMLIAKEIIKFGMCTQILDYEFIQSFKFYE